MSKTKDTPKPSHDLGGSRLLRSDELDHVSGGACCNGQHISEIVVTKPTDVSSYSFGASNPYKTAQAEGYGN
jgi:hypothetical protein